MRRLETVFFRHIPNVGDVAIRTKTDIKAFEESMQPAVSKVENIRDKLKEQWEADTAINAEYRTNTNLLLIGALSNFQKLQDAEQMVNALDAMLQQIKGQNSTLTGSSRFTAVHSIIVSEIQKAVTRNKKLLDKGDKNLSKVQADMVDTIISCQLLLGQMQILDAIYELQEFEIIARNFSYKDMQDVPNIMQSFMMDQIKDAQRIVNVKKETKYNKSKVDKKLRPIFLNMFKKAYESEAKKGEKKLTEDKYFKHYLRGPICTKFKDLCLNPHEKLTSEGAQILHKNITDYDKFHNKTKYGLTKYRVDTAVTTFLCACAAVALMGVIYAFFYVIQVDPDAPQKLQQFAVEEWAKVDINEVMKNVVSGFKSGAIQVGKYSYEALQAVINSPLWGEVAGFFSTDITKEAQQVVGNEASKIFGSGVLDPFA